MFEDDYAQESAFIADSCFFFTLSVYLNACRLSTVPWFILLPFLPLSCPALLYIVLFFFIFPSFIYTVCASICLQNSHNGCCLGHLHAFIFFCLLLPFLLISLPLSSVVIFRVLGFKWSQTFHFYALQKQHKEHVGTAKQSRDTPKVRRNILSLPLKSELKS